MDFVWIVPLILALVSSEQSLAEVTEQTSDGCPAGHHRDCEFNSQKCQCKICGDDTYTDEKNSLDECMRCRNCRAWEVKTKNCSSDTNARCDCKEGHFYSDSNSALCKNCKEVRDNAGHLSKECMENPDCMKKCAANVPLPPSVSIAPTVKVSTKTPALTPVQFPEIRSTTVTQPLFIAQNEKVWLVLVVVGVAAFLVLFWVWLLCSRSLLRNQDSCPCWSANKDSETSAQDPKSNAGSSLIISASSLTDQRSHQGSSPATLTFNEEIPMMSPLQEPPAHISHHWPNSNYIAERQDEQLDRWPAIVLYAIIKEVPLRRWKEFLRLLSVTDQQMERVELEAGLGSMEKQYQMLSLWSQRPSASLDEVYSSLHYMDLSGCAQLLQESLEKLQWRPEKKRGFTA
ncbi:tumor necrosis factor receptor superfamily member 1A [Odontesthes bonariensis]|uniref:tumor necrosis factor receptor superfamily member 1A n=1 Tax=Odontesthes bonariensis TaxID=219752 RepID=UPI003F58BFA3